MFFSRQVARKVESDGEDVELDVDDTSCAYGDSQLDYQSLYSLTIPCLSLQMMQI